MRTLSELFDYRQESRGPVDAAPAMLTGTLGDFFLGAYGLITRLRECDPAELPAAIRRYEAECRRVLGEVGAALAGIEPGRLVAQSPAPAGPMRSERDQPAPVLLPCSRTGPSPDPAA
jgi:hypothetical protein